MMNRFGIGLLRLSLQLIVVSADQTFCSLLSCQESDVVGRALDDLLSPRDRRGALALSKAISGGAVSDEAPHAVIDQSVGLRVGTIDHRTRIRLSRDSEGFFALVERLQGDADLLDRMSRGDHYFTSVLRHSEDGVAVLDADNQLLRHNAQFFELLRVTNARGIAVTEDAVTGLPLRELLPAAVFRRLASYLSVRTDDDVELTEQATHHGRTLQVRVTPLSAPLRGRIGALVFLRDVTVQVLLAERDARVMRDMEDSRAFQEAMLPSYDPPKGFALDVVFRPVDRIGGDFYDAASIPGGMRVLVGDATGHGVRAALVTILVRCEYEAIKLSAATPAHAMKLLNDRIASTYPELAIVFTACIMDVSAETGAVTFACGAHPPPVLVTEGAVREIEATGSFLGSSVVPTFTDTTAQLSPGETLFLLTDGVEEAGTPTPFGGEPMRRALADSARCEKPAAALHQRLLAYLSPRAPDDDVIVLAITRKRPEKQEDT